MKKEFFLITISITLLACNDSEKKVKLAKEEKIAKESRLEDALTLAIERNLRNDYITSDCSTFGKKSTLVSEVFTIPIKSEIIDAAADLRAFRENMNESQRLELKATGYKDFLNSNKVSCIVAVINNRIDNGESISFPDFKNNITMQLENGMKLPLIGYTPALEKNLTSGLNSGYVYFSGTIPDSINSYSVIFSKINLVCSNAENQTSKLMAFSFDRSKLEFLSLLDNGFDKNSIRTKYSLKAYEQRGLTIENFQQIISLTLSLFKLADAVKVIL
jgi:hypothetical protein